MSTVIFFTAFVLLVVGMWAFVVVCLWYGQKLLKRQQELTAFLISHLDLQKKNSEGVQSLSISKDELLEKYKEVTLPEQVQVAFTEEEKEK